MAILVTGGAGYIGSHTVVELQNAGYDVVVLDNLSNASEKSLDRVSKITGKPVKFYKADILDRDALNEIFDKEEIDSCIHFAGLPAVHSSCSQRFFLPSDKSIICPSITLLNFGKIPRCIFFRIFLSFLHGHPATIPVFCNFCYFSLSTIPILVHSIRNILDNSECNL